MNKIEDISKTLKLSYFKDHYEEHIKIAKQTNQSYEDFLEQLLIEEQLRRKNNGVQTRIRLAKFPQKKYLEDFQLSHFKEDFRKKLKDLETLEFISNKENIILMSNPGMGKTHYATALGIKACLDNKRVLFTSVPNLIIELKEAMSQNQITKYKNKFERYDLVILDELGYVSFDREGSEILFNLISNRVNVGSIIITTNLLFDRWEEIFKDPVLTTAMVDRLAFKSHIINMSGESYRIKETQNWLKEKEQL